MLETAIGFVIAAAIGITGVGAGTLTVPVLILFLGVPPTVAVGTALVFSTLVKIPAGISYIINGNVEWKTLRLMLAGGIPGTLAGSLLLANFATDEKVKAGVFSCVGAIILFTALANLIITLRNSEIRLQGNPSVTIPAASSVIGLEVGFSSAGAGALGTILLLGTTTLAPAAIVGTDIAFGLVISAAGGSIHLGLGNVDYLLLWKLVQGGVVGAIAGSMAANYVPAKPMRVALLIWLMVIGSALIIKGF